MWRPHHAVLIGVHHRLYAVTQPHLVSMLPTCVFTVAGPR